MSFLTKISSRQPLHLQSQIAQVKSAGLVTISPNTQGVPKTLSNVSVTVKKVGTQRRVTVAFIGNPNDVYFTHAEVYLQIGQSNPSLVAQGSSSPLSFTVSSTNTPAVVIVVSSGNWGRTEISSSPSASLTLK